MINILSYAPGTVFAGKEIKAWIRYHLEHETSHTREAKHMQRYLNISDHGKYIIRLSYETSGCQDIRHQPIVVQYMGS